jgi:RHS repeat-associated protein
MFLGLGEEGSSIGANEPGAPATGSGEDAGAETDAAAGGGGGVPLAPVAAPVVRKYTWGLDLAGLNGAVNGRRSAGGIGGLLAGWDGGTYSYTTDDRSFLYFYDGHGNVGQLVDWGISAICAVYEYDPYGNLTAKTGSYADRNPMRFSTKYWDVETGWGDWGRRYYDPLRGRWLNRDPIGETGGANLYGYADDDPITVVGPHSDGLQLRVR